MSRWRADRLGKQALFVRSLASCEDTFHCRPFKVVVGEFCSTDGQKSSEQELDFVVSKMCFDDFVEVWKLKGFFLIDPVRDAAPQGLQRNCKSLISDNVNSKDAQNLCSLLSPPPILKAQ